MTERPQTDHWLARPGTIRKLWFALTAFLALLLAAEAVVGHEGHYRLDGSFGFAAWLGLLSCVAMVAFAKALGAILKRSDTYYDG